jgi:hypothetical protein
VIARSSGLRLVTPPVATPTTPTTGSACSARHSSESNEFYSPWHNIVGPMRAVLKHVHLDPASCAEANLTVDADHYFDEKTDGLTQRWDGNVFLNPPGGWCDDRGRRVIKPNKPKNGDTPTIACTVNGACGLPIGHTHSGTTSSSKAWWTKLAREYAEGRTKAAIYVAFTLDQQQTTQIDVPAGLSSIVDWPMCILRRRVAFVQPGGKAARSNSHASAIVLVAPSSFDDAFHEAFAPHGSIVIPRKRGA